jgi:hypothetical protein
LTIQPLSVQYVHLNATPGSRSFELRGQARGGPAPVMSLLLGLRQRPGARALLRRFVTPCLLTFPPEYATFTNRVAVNIGAKVERTNNLLIVANPSSKTIRYTITFASSKRRVASPSPAEKKRLSPRTFCKKRRDSVHARGSDPLGDAEGGLAPDIGQLDITSATAVASAETFVVFAVELRNRAELGRGDLVVVSIDSDRNTKTGCLAGAEYALAVAGLPGPDPYRLGRCRNGTIDFNTAQGSFVARFDGTIHRTLVVMAAPRDLGGARRFNFRVGASWRKSSDSQLYLDSAPDGDFVFCFPTCKSSATTPLSSGHLELRRLR